MGWLLVLAVAAVVAWSVATGGSRFMHGLALLLDEPDTGPSDALSVLRGRESLGGKYLGRAVTVTLQQSRENFLGHLVIAMQARTPLVVRIARRSSVRTLAGHLSPAFDAPVGDQSLDSSFVFHQDAGGGGTLRAWLSEPGVRAALDGLVLDEGLEVAVEAQGVTATWRAGYSLFPFPGRFQETKWRRVLHHLSVLAASFDSFPPGR